MGGGWVDIATEIAPKPQGAVNSMQSQAWSNGLANKGSTQ